MKISLNLVKQFTPVDLPVDELVHKLNQQLGEVEEVTQLGDRYKGAVIARIVSCEDHPDADRLHVCRVDDGGVTQGVERGEDGLVQVVCGAPNARAGITVVWLPPGATVPSSFGDAEPFVLSVRPLRGVNSNGMLASPRELAIGDSHEGILEIGDGDAPLGKTDAIKPGASFAGVFGLDDTIIDIENKMFTHRPDCFGVLGVAREIAGIQHKQFTSPEWYAKQPEFVSGEGLVLEVRNDAADVVPRLMAVAVKDVTIKPSPLWLQVELVRLGSRPINNIVDVTNYVMLLTGQPLHAYDYDKIAQDGRVVLGARRAGDGEQIALLSGKTITLTPDDVVITDGTKPVGIGGVMGGADSEVSNETKNIILECAHFDMYAIRKTSMRHGLFTDAVTRFNKGQSPLQNPHILNLALLSVFDVAGGGQASLVIDDRHLPEDDETLANEAVQTVDVDFINKRLGLSLTDQEIVGLLQNVEFHGHDMGEMNQICVTPPFWRTDIELPEDIVEEVGRLYGFDKLPQVLPQRSIAPAAENPTLKLKRAVRAQLATLGANEVLTYSFVHENVLTRAGQDASLAYRLGNALSPDLQYYRLGVLPSLLDKVHANAKAGYDAFALFEVGKAHATTEVDEDGLPREFDHLAFVVTAQDKSPHKQAGAAYYQARAYLEKVLGGRAAQCTLRPLADATLDGRQLTEQMVRPFEPGRSAVLWDGEKVVGVVGEFKPGVGKAFKLPPYTAGFELFLSSLQAGEASSYVPLPRFPKVWQDISLRVAADVPYQKLYDVVAGALHGQESASLYATLEPTSLYQSPEDTAHKNVTFRYSVASYDKTMTDAEVSGMLDAAAAAAAEQCGAERI